MRNVFKYFKFFRELTGPTLTYLVGLMLGAGLADALGLSLFLPLLEGKTRTSAVGHAIVGAFTAVGIEYSLGSVLLTVIFIFFLRSALLAFKDIYVGRTLASLLVKVRTEVVAGLFQTNYEYLTSKDAGYLNNAVTVEATKVMSALQAFVGVLHAALFAVILLAVPLALAPLTTIGLFAFGFPAWYAIRRLNRVTAHYSVKRSDESAKLQRFLIQALRCSKYLKATHSHPRVLAKVNRASEELGHVATKLAAASSLSSHGFAPFVLLIVAVFLYCNVELMGREMAATAFVLFLIKRGVDQALGVQKCYRSLLQCVGSLSVYRALTSEIREHREDMAAAGIKPDFSHPLCLSNVSFRYVRSDYVLRDIRIEIPPKSMVAFVGASGAGKSTVASVLTGILRPTDGAVTLGGTDYRELDQMQLREAVGYVTQETVVFNDTIRNNITLWENEACMGRLHSAAAEAHVDAFVGSLPDKYETLLGDDGINISGGQRQRISIARELFKDVKLLIFDEATSALDTETEREIQKNIDELRGDRTIVLVAHRLSTVRNCDRIFVLKDGEVVEEGSYDELCAANGEFRRMVDLQQGNGLSKTDERA